MHFSTTPVRVDPTRFGGSASEGPAATVRRVVADAAAADGADPLDEAALLALRHGLGSSALWLAGEAGFAWRRGDAVDVVVAPAERGRGLGAALAEVATEQPGPLTAWSHGNHPAAVALAHRLSFERVRDLWVMRRPLADLPAADRPGDADPVDVRTFEVGRDEDAFLALNAEAFAHHPEQGALTRGGLEQRMAEPWFDPAGFFVAERDGELVGFHWTKVHDATASAPALGEVYVVGVSPTAQGGGLGRRLTLAGLHHLAGLGLAQVLLYVEADNAPAVAVYRRLGFTHLPADTHVQYARRERPAD
jgi:mycothiol synthase